MSKSDLSAPFWDHVEQLRLTLIRILATIACGFIIAFLFYPQIFTVLKVPLDSIKENMDLVVLGPTDGLMTTIKTCFWVSFVGTSPIWLLFVLQFVSPALKGQERRFILPFLILSLFFLSCGFLFSFYITIPLANNYLQAFNENIGTNLWALSFYLDYTVILLLANGLGFELCLILLFLVHYKRISAEWMAKRRRGAIVGIFLLSAFLTPPDVLTQVLLALPLVLLYECAILYARFRKL